jgi:hypothetical protein
LKSNSKGIVNLGSLENYSEFSIACPELEIARAWNIPKKHSYSYRSNQNIVITGEDSLTIPFPSESIADNTL